MRHVLHELPSRLDVYGLVIQILLGYQPAVEDVQNRSALRHGCHTDAVHDVLLHSVRLLWRGRARLHVQLSDAATLPRLLPEAATQHGGAEPDVRVALLGVRDLISNVVASLPADRLRCANHLRRVCVGDKAILIKRFHDAAPKLPPRTAKHKFHGAAVRHSSGEVLLHHMLAHSGTHVDVPKGEGHDVTQLAVLAHCVADDADAKIKEHVDVEQRRDPDEHVDREDGAAASEALRRYVL
mmetsp:Transcript_53353/g.148377  ORF Transcript_53353/g.148377 Transcript_53353/m.148377 type:complete len:240 (-) Transcript_53353:572-1291(-)